MRDQTDSRTLSLPLPLAGKRSFPFVVHHGQRLIGVYWAPDARRAAADARAEAATFGPVTLGRARLRVELHAAASMPGVARNA
jgi:hypothetical protein